MELNLMTRRTNVGRQKEHLGEGGKCRTLGLTTAAQISYFEGGSLTLPRPLGFCSRASQQRVSSTTGTCSRGVRETCIKEAVYDYGVWRGQGKLYQQASKNKYIAVGGRPRLMDLWYHIIGQN